MLNRKYSHLSDCHNHSGISLDGKDSVSAMLDRAVELGFDYYALTDHCECNTYIEEDYKGVVRRAWNEMTAQKEKYKDKLHFLRGIELGQPLQNLSAAADAINGRDYDLVLGSLHNLNSYKDFFCWEELYLDVYTALDKYFDEINDMIDWGNFDSLTHLTYPLRYIVGENGIEVDFTKYYERVRLVFKKLIEKGIALEMNTSGLRQKIGETLPNAELLKMYRELGGELLTVGSDAHCCEDLGKGISEGFDILKAAGFEYFTVFEKRKPIFVPIA